MQINVRASCGLTCHTLTDHCSDNVGLFSPAGKKPMSGLFPVFYCLLPLDQFNPPAVQLLVYSKAKPALSITDFISQRQRVSGGSNITLQ